MWPWLTATTCAAMLSLNRPGNVRGSWVARTIVRQIVELAQSDRRFDLTHCSGSSHQRHAGSSEVVARGGIFWVEPTR